MTSTTTFKSTRNTFPANSYNFAFTVWVHTTNLTQQVCITKPWKKEAMSGRGIDFVYVYVLSNGCGNYSESVVFVVFHCMMDCIWHGIFIITPVRYQHETSKWLQINKYVCTHPLRLCLSSTSDIQLYVKNILMQGVIECRVIMCD